MKPSHILAMLVGSALSLGAQNAFDGPISGYVFDSATHAVRSLLGVPGGALLSPALTGAAAGPAWDFLSVAPNGKRALGIADGSIDLIPDLSNPASFTVVAPLQTPVERIAWSGDSTTAALWSPRSRDLRRITGLDAAPAVHNPVDLTVIGEISGWSLSPDGLSLAIAGPGSGRTSLYISQGDAAPVALALVNGAGPVVFAADGASLFVASADRFGGTGQQILRIDARSGAVIGSLGGNPVQAPAPALEGRGVQNVLRIVVQASRIAGLAPSADSSRLYTVAGNNLCGYDLASGTPSCQSLQITPSSLEKMPEGRFLLNYYRTASMPLWLLDAKTGQIYFVPSGISSDNASN